MQINVSSNNWLAGQYPNGKGIRLFQRFDHIDTCPSLIEGNPPEADLGLDNEPCRMAGNCMKITVCRLAYVGVVKLSWHQEIIKNLNVVKCGQERLPAVVMLYDAICYTFLSN